MSTSTLMAGPAAGRPAWQPGTAFVLAGGAAPGALQAGMIHALDERGITPDLLTGTSAGALNAAFPAARPATTATAHQLAARRRARLLADGGTADNPPASHALTPAPRPISLLPTH